MTWRLKLVRVLGFVEGVVALYLLVAFLIFVCSLRDMPNRPEQAVRTAAIWLPLVAAQAAQSDDE